MDLMRRVGFTIWLLKRRGDLTTDDEVILAAFKARGLDTPRGG
jgi:hypothetical protein